MGGGGDSNVSRGPRGARQWKVESAAAAQAFLFLWRHRTLPTVAPATERSKRSKRFKRSRRPNVLNVLKIPTNARRAAPRPYSKGSDRASGLHGDWRWELGCGREHV